MKRLFCMSIVLLLLFACAVSAHATDNYVILDGFAFDLDENGSAVIHDYDDRASDVTVPATLLGAQVVCIDDYAFFMDTTVTSVRFDDAIRLTRIGDSAFCGCSSLTELSLPGQAALGFGAFQSCSGLTALTLDDGIAAIPEQCFFRCTALSEISIPSSVTTIGVRSFAGCESLQYVYLSDAVEYIAPNAFEGDEDLTIRCEKDSYAARYGKKNSIRVAYYDSYLRGDADGDGAVTIIDATAIQRMLADLPQEVFLSSAADVDGCGLTVVDATYIQRYLVGFEDACGIAEALPLQWTEDTGRLPL